MTTDDPYIKLSSKLIEIGDLLDKLPCDDNQQKAEMYAALATLAFLIVQHGVNSLKGLQ
jgi:hypothetical protein